MAFIFESQNLDLSKKYIHFEYKSLTGDAAPSVKFDFGEELKTEATEGINQNQYLLLQEKDLLIYDIRNIECFMRKYWLDTLDLKTLEPVLTEEQKAIAQKFPFQYVKNRICFVFQKYQEQPALLDPVVETVVQTLMSIVESYLITALKSGLQEFTVKPEFHEILNIVYILCKVRGFKFINKFFPHEVKDLEPVLFYLVRQRNNDITLWETKYILILWMSIIILVPFDLSTIDSKLTSLVNTTKQKTIYENILDIMKFYLNSSTKTRDSASLFLSHFFSRPDIQKSNLLSDYLTWACKSINDLKDDPFHSFYVTGVFHSLVEIFKIGQRNEIIDKIPKVIPLIIDEEEQKKDEKKKSSESGALRLLKCKLAQRIAMQYLRPRINTWAYKRSSNSLVENFKKTTSTSKLQSNVVNKVTQNTKSNTIEVSSSVTGQRSEDFNEDDYMDGVDGEHLEGIIDFLLQALKDKETVVRWSAAKGIGRITQRLDQDMADEVVNSLLELFSPHEGDNTWHGGCLAIGELSRRGLLLPERLKDAFPILFKALLYDQNQGNYSVGANVRDSACYVAWAFARAYDPSLIKDNMLSLAQHLLLVSVFDREVNCRRAASASFQEHVGRQGNFPHGIDILTEADYFTLGIRTNAYLKVAPFVAHYEEYFPIFVDHLVEVKLKNWDLDLRKLAAATLSLICCFNPEYVVKRALPKLIENCTHENLLVRHGAIYGVSEIILGLAGKSHLHCCHNIAKDSIFLKSLSKNERKLMKAGEYMNIFKDKYEAMKVKNNLELLDKATLESIYDIVSKIDKARLYRGKGGDTMRNGVCRLIECISIAELKLTNVTLKKYIATLDECIVKPLDDIQASAESSLKAFSERYHDDNKKDFEVFCEKLIAKANTDPNIAVIRGYTRALSCLPLRLLKVGLDKVFNVLEDNCKIKGKDTDDAETRKYAITAYEQIIRKLLDETELILNTQHIEKFLDCCFRLLDDYTTDKRGDIGSMVREAAMYSISAILKKLSFIYSKNADFPIKLNSDYVHKAVYLILQQLAEKIDRTRLISGSIMQDLADNAFANLPDFPQKAQVFSTFNKENIQKLLKAEQDRLQIDFSLLEEMKAKQFSTISTQQVDFDQVNLLDSEAFIYYWNLPHCVFPLIAPLLQYKEYSYYLIKGLCISVGGLTESVNKHSYQALTDYVIYCGNHANSSELLNRLLEDCIQIFSKHPDEERIIVPLIKTLERMFEKDELLNRKDVLAENLNKIYESIHKEIIKTKSIGKLTAGVCTLVGLLRFNLFELSKKIFSLGPNFVLHKFPMVRKQYIDKLYFYLMMAGEEIFGTDLNDSITALLTENDWFEMTPDQLKNMKEEVEKAFEKLKDSLSKSTA